MKTLRHTFLILLVLLLQACSEMTPMVKKEAVDDVELVWQERQSKLHGIVAWALQGRIAVKTSNDAWSATLQWAQQKQLYMMRVIAPFGQGTYEIKRGLDKVSLLTAENEYYEAGDAESLMLENLGWSVPVEGMKYWIRGLPDPDYGIDSSSIDESALLTELQQAGWQISLTSYRQQGEYFLPGKIILKNDHMKVTILAKDWLKVM